MNRFLYIIIFILSFQAISGQHTRIDKEYHSDCYPQLQEAEHIFGDGHFESCITILEGILNSCKLTNSEKENALELLIKAYVLIDRTAQADSAGRQLLKDNPHYELVEDNNPEEYNSLIKKFDVHPRFSIGVRNAYNTIKYTKTKTFRVLNYLDYTAPYNHKGFTSFYYGWAEYEFNNGISLNADLIFFWTSYNRFMAKDPSFSLTYSERNSFMEIPVYIKKYFPIGKNILPYVALGAGWLRMTDATASASISYTKNDNALTGNNYDYIAYTENIDVISMRNINMFEIIEGIGIGYKFRNIRFFLDARLYGGLTSLTKESNRFDNPTLINDYYYIDNTVKLTQFEIGASISYTLLNSVKKKK